ncbi:cuticle protein 16.5-like [Sipha flava]|uniref:Cuticle protein 16.5-like n=1 Tax=Sipha flava TaxID=143950 RepID=A0A8B8GGJ5_9HEMI|nr:cuticle protein 16.5-like [Sipha flava]
MASFKCLIFIALAVYSVAAVEETREKRGAYIAAAPAPVLSYSAVAPVAYPYAYSAARSGSFSYGYSAPAYAAAYPAAAYSAATYPASTYPAVRAYPAAAAYAAYPAAAYAAYPSYAEDDGSYWPGKYEKKYIPAVYPAAAYHY